MDENADLHTTSDLAATLAATLRSPAGEDPRKPQLAGKRGLFRRAGSFPRRLVAMILGCLTCLAACLSLPSFVVHPEKSTWIRERVLSPAQINWDTTAPQQINSVVARLSALDLQGLPALVAGLHHAHPAVNRACDAALQNVLCEPHATAHPGQAMWAQRLAQLLAEHSSTASSDSLRRSANLALLLLDTVPHSAANNGKCSLTFHCEQVVTAAHAVRAQVPDEVLGQQHPVVQGPSSLANDRSGRAPLPIAPPAMTQSVPTGTAGRAAQDTTASPMPVPTAQPNWQPRRQSVGAARPLLGISSSAPTAKDEALPQSEETIAKPLPPGVAVLSLSEDELMRGLVVAQFREQAAAELRRRGFSSRDIEIAAHAVDPNPHKREQLAQLLPELSGVDPRPWLLFLSRDTSPQVRVAAVRWLATTSDPQIRDWLRELASRETDDEVRALLR